MAREKKVERRRRKPRVKVYVGGKWIPLSEVAKKIEAPLTRTSRELLSVLAEKREPISPKELASLLKRTQTTVYRSLKNLEKRGFVVKIRRGIMALTENGYKAIKKLAKK
jgi:DNA-binding MarR family transcriptional regulator